MNSFSMTKKETQKKFDPEELDNKVDPLSNDPAITKEGAQFDPEESDNGD